MFIQSQVNASFTQAINQSHERSVRYGVDPNITKAPEHVKLNSIQLEQRIKKHPLFYTIALEQMQMLYNLLRSTGFCMALADNDGYVLSVVGDDDLYEHFVSRNCIPGYRWTEKDMGTCAIGTCLIEQKPFFIQGNQMYSKQAKHISSAVAPVFGMEQELLGIIVLSGYSERMHIHTLGLVCQAAETVNARLTEYSRSQELKIKNQYMSALLEAGTRGVVTVDSCGKIVQTNKKARSLLALPQNYVGKKFDSFVKLNFNLLEELKVGSGVLIQECVSKNNNYFISLAPVISDKKKNIGGILSIIEKKEMVELAMGIAGAEAKFTFQSIIGESSLIKSAIHIAKIAAKNDAPVLVLGETGTGKELFAQAIHNMSDRRDKPFIAINCGAIPKELLESELFGYEEGAFTGAQKGGRAGKFEVADTGTLFLDEIGDMPFDMQVKLLRVLQMGEIQRVGSTNTRKINIRVISATNKDLQNEAKAERFRPDLFYRISTLSLTVPPLRERGNDITMLVEYFMQRHGYNVAQGLLCPKAKNLLMGYSWPGNVRQLENMVERAIYFAQGAMLKTKHFDLIDVKNNVMQIGDDNKFNMETIEEDTIRKALAYHQGNLTQCATSLGMTRPKLYRKLEKYQIDPITKNDPATKKWRAG